MAPKIRATAHNIGNTRGGAAAKGYSPSVSATDAGLAGDLGPEPGWLHDYYGSKSMLTVTVPVDDGGNVSHTEWTQT